jgi:hypothetical protein
MPSYDLRRLDGDPTYAPGRVYDNGTPYWRPTKADMKAGYSIKSYRLTGTDEEQCARCRELTRELLQWRDGKPKMVAGTWGWIIARYRSDDLSPFQEVKPNTRKSYLEEISYWEDAIGESFVAGTSFETLKRIKKGMEANGRSVAFIHRKFTHLRMVANYGLAVQPSLFRDICSVLASGAMKVRAPKPRTTSPTAAQVQSIIDRATALAEHGFALGISLQWWLALRAVDVRGQWLTEGKSRRWADGLTWDMVDLKAGTITKAASKTERHDGTAITWDLNPIPGLLDMLRAIPEDQRIGPVIKRDGKPFEKEAYSNLWRRIAKQVGVPPEVQMRDTRAGAINDAMMHGANKLQMQHAAGHLNSDTTERYIRAREQNAQTVIQLRAGK